MRNHLLPLTMLLALASASTVHADLLVNPGFEANAVASAPPNATVTGWTKGATGFTASSPAPVRSGVGSLLLDAPGGFSVPVAFQTFPASPGQVVDLQGYMLTPAALPANTTFGLLKIVFSDGVNDLAVGAGDVLIGQPGPGANPGVEGLPFLNSSSTPNTWIFAQARGIAPPGTTQMKLFAINVDQSSARMYFDDLQGPVMDPAVTTNADEDNGTADPGTGAGTSLREAIRYATPGSTITFAPGLSGQTILLTSGHLVLDKSVTIDASALPGGITLNGNNASRIFEVNSGTTVILTALTLTNGNAAEGGGLLNRGTLTVNQSTLAGNQTAFGGGGIANSGTLTLNQSTLAGNQAAFGGGGIANNGTLTLNQSTLSGNSAVSGGGAIDNNATLTLNQCTLVGNQAPNNGGAIWAGGTVQLNNCTVTANTVGNGTGGGIDRYASATIRLTNTIVANNSAPTGPNINGLFTGSNNLTNGVPLLAPLGNYGGPTPTMPPLPGSPAIDGCTSGTPFTTDQRGAGFPRVMNFYADIGAAEALVPSIPNASFEADTFTVYPGYANANGGGITGWTLSYPPQMGLNPAGGNPFADNGAVPAGANVAFMQGGVVTMSTTISGLTPGASYRVSFRANGRASTTEPLPTWSLNGGAFVPFTAWPPVGAANPYYANSAVFTAAGTTTALALANERAGDTTVLLDAFTVAPMLVVVTTNNNSGPGSLRQAIAEVGDGGSITFAPGLSGQTILLTSGELVLGKSVTIDASALAGGITLNGNNASRIFRVNLGTTVFLTALTLTNGNEDGGIGGGGILNYGTLTLNKSTLAGNHADGGIGGGGILNDGTLTLNKSTLAGNHADGGIGGGIHNAGTLTLNQSTLAGNHADGGFGGGGIYNGGTLTLNQSTLAGNHADGSSGGGIFNGGTLNLFNSIVAGNSASIAGLNIYGSFAGNNNLTSGDPLLAPLGHYGGPTMTMPPLPGSPAINTAGATGFLTDQRGFPRLVGPAPDIGAVEGPVPPTPFLAAGGPWKYLANGSDQGTAWRAPVFDDSAWSNGTARLGFGGDGEATTIASAASNFVTFYFRQSFTVASAAAVTNLFGQIQVDDGVILYLNGTEIYRRNMTNEPVTLNYRSLATVTVGGADEQTFWTFNTNSLALVNGVNVLAAEVHQVTTNSSDLGFNLDLVGNYNGELPPVIAVTSPTTTAPYNAAGIPLLVNARDPEGTVTNVDFYVDGLFASRVTNAPFTGLWTTPTLGAHTVHAVATDNTGLTAVSQNQPFTVVPPSVLTTLVNSNSTWRYLDDGSNQGTLWRTNTYNDAGWSNGVAELGYGDGPTLPEATVIRSTGTNGQRIITTYFRKTFNVAQPEHYSNLVVRLRRDDGGVVYLNGVEIFRSNMTNAPGVPVLFTNLALNATDEVSFFSTSAPASLLRAGDNLVAVEIHQTTAASSDVSFDLQMQAESGPLLFINQAGGLVTLNWLPAIPGLVLQFAPTPSGPWTPALNQANPQSFTVNPLDLPVFWRLLAP